jgi:thiol-disulfide isomerase/thioredoxin
MHPMIRTLVPLLLIVCGILAGFFGYRSLHRATLFPVASQPSAPGAGPPAAAATHPTSAPVPAPTGPAAPPASPAIPDTLPDVHVPDLTGRSRSLSEFRGHPLVVNFWATWCAPCRREMPLLQSLWQQHQADLRIVGIAVDSREAVQQYLHTTPVGYPILADSDQGSAALSALGIEPVLPISVFADPQGRIVTVKLGELHRDEAGVILSAVQQVSLGRESVPEARKQLADELRQLAVQRAKRDAQPLASP